MADYGGASGIWDFLTEGLFAVFMVSLIAAMNGITNSFSSLLFGIFGNTVETKLNELNSTSAWVNTVKGVLDSSATLLKDTVDVQTTVYPIVSYIILFTLFLGSIVSIIVMATASVRQARAVVG